jgi:hypothetical protein
MAGMPAKFVGTGEPRGLEAGGDSDSGLGNSAKSGNWESS